MAGSKSSAEFSPDYLLPHDVVLVTINYRVGVFGGYLLQHLVLAGRHVENAHRLLHAHRFP